MMHNLVAYLLIGVLIAATVTAIAYRIYNSRDRRYARQKIRDRKAHAARLAEQNDKAG